MIFRRIKCGQIAEGIEITPIEASSRESTSDDREKNDSIKVCFVHMEEDTLLYDVEFPKNYQVKPPDLRRFAYDHEKVESLIAHCIHDNFARYAFEIVNDSLLERLQNELFVALQDLRTVMDLLSVECHPDNLGESIEVQVSYEHKNGERKTGVVMLNKDFD